VLERQYVDASNLDARIRLHARFSTNPGWYEWLLAHYRVPSRGRILELGCGSGHFWRELGTRVPDGWEIMLTDLSPGMLEAVKRNLEDVPRSFRFQQVDIQAIPFDSGSFDAVIAHHMLYHVANRNRAFAEVRRVLRARGQFYAATNGEWHLLELDQALERLGIRSEFAWDAYSFSLQSGGPQLSEWFDWVTVDLYDDALEVSEVEPLVDYVRSLRPGTEGGDVRLRRFEEWAKQQLAANGSIHITKSSGLFTAS
jgi:SAM-dependent methyltransferase